MEGEAPCRGLALAGQTPGWMEELTETSVGSSESEEDCGLSDTGEGWTLLGCLWTLLC